MITRGKSSLRRGTLSAFTDSIAGFPATYEPLHFLYPWWASSGLQLQLTRAYSVRTSCPSSTPRRPKICQPQRHHRSVDLQCRPLSSQQVPSATGIRIENGSNVSTANVENDDGLNDKAPDDQNLDNYIDAYIERKIRLEDYVERILPLNTHVTEDDASDGRRINIRRPQSASRRSTLNKNKLPDEASGQSAESPANYKKKINIKNVRSLLHPWKDRRSQIAQRVQSLRETGQLVRYERSDYRFRLRRRNDVKRWRQVHSKDHRLPPHWTELMRLLEEMHLEMPVTRPGIIEANSIHKELLVRQEVITQLSGSSEYDENIWYVGVRNGCRIRVLDAGESEGIYRKTIISGTPRAIELVEEQIRKVDSQQIAGLNAVLDKSGSIGRAQMMRSPVPIIPSLSAFQRTKEPLPLVRAYYEKGQDRYTSGTKQSNSTITNVKRFALRVQQVIAFTKKERLKRRLNLLSPLVVACRLEKLFTDPASQPCLSSDALNRALKFLLRYEYLKQARTVLEVSRAVATTETYNILLWSTALRQDLFFFRSVLARMKKSGLQPNGWTWNAFVRSLLSPGPRNRVLERMEELGILKDTKVKNAMIRQNIGMFLAPYLGRPQGIESFVSDLEATYGRSLITTGTANKILHHVKEQKNHKLLKEVLNTFRKYGIRPNSDTIGLGLNHYYRIQYAAGDLLEYIQPLEKWLKPRIYEKMFLMAIHSSMPNTCRVIWRYACMKKATTPLMRHIVRISLSGKHIGRSKDPSQIEHHIGAIVVGIEYQPRVRVYGQAYKMVPREHGRNAVTYMIENIPPESSLRKKMAKQLVKDDVARGPNRQKYLEFAVMLDAAIRMDKQTTWHSNDPEYPALNRRSTGEILKELIIVPVR